MQFLTTAYAYIYKIYFTASYLYCYIYRLLIVYYYVDTIIIQSNPILLMPFPWLQNAWLLEPLLDFPYESMSDCMISFISII